MCGRARCSLRADDVPRACYRSRPPSRSVDLDRYRPSFNVAPGWNVAVVRREEAREGEEEEPPYAVHSMKWGLIPTFTKKTDKPDFYKMFNARADSVAEKASFRRLLPKNRCLVAAEGFYEWKKDGSKRQPYYVHFKDGRPLVFAALYDSWKNSEGEILYTFTIITTSSSPALEWLHDRMPVILGDKGATDSWLNDSTTSKLDEVLKPYKDSDLVWYPVTPAMGKLSYDGPECVKEIKLKTEDKNTISKFFSKRQIKEEKEPKVEESITLGNSADTNLEKSVKEEQLDIDDKFEDSSVRKVLDQKLVPKLLASPTTDDTKRESKRDHEKFQTDSRQTRDESNKLGSSPPRKKASLKSGADKQPTLHSYFGKR